MMMMMMMMKKKKNLSTRDMHTCVLKRALEREASWGPWRWAKQENNEKKAKMKKATPRMPKTVNKPVEAAGAAAAVADAKAAAAAAAAASTADAKTSSSSSSSLSTSAQKMADADAILAAVATTDNMNVSDMEAAEAKAAALLASVAEELSAAEATVQKAEEVEKAFKAGKMAAKAAETAANANAAVAADASSTSATTESVEDKKISDMKARARNLLLNMKDTRDAPAGGAKATYSELDLVSGAEVGVEVGGGVAREERMKISKVNPAMTPEEIAAFWQGGDNTSSFHTVSHTRHIFIITPPLSRQLHRHINRTFHFHLSPRTC